MRSSVIEDHREKTKTITRYDYDALGRRTLVQDEGSALMRTLYDGMSFDIIREQESFADGYFTNTSDTYVDWQASGEESASRYRYIGEEAGSNGGNPGQANSSGSNSGNFRANSNADYRLVSPNRSRSSVTLFAKKVYVCDTASVARKGGVVGEEKLRIAKDGFPPLNHGYRDYSPKTARFTTVDPIRDGHNWYAYCSNDPVNFVDLWGLEAGDKKYVTGVKDTHVIYPQYVFAEGEGFLGSYTYDIYTSVKNSNNGYTLNVWAVATSGPQSRHDDIQYFGSVNLNVNGKKVESKQLTQIGSYVINSSSVMVGEASFSLPQNGEVSVTIVNTGYSYNGAEGTTVVSSTKKHTIEIEVMK
ncbi:MAG TPA: RHS repeat-associated core domain-containing protein [Edaphocola sp.]|nr:RHS repeat-associated core domain-containing protein [Edaphocola sp.]